MPPVKGNQNSHNQDNNILHASHNTSPTPVASSSAVSDSSGPESVIQAAIADRTQSGITRPGDRPVTYTLNSSSFLMSSSSSLPPSSPTSSPNMSQLFLPLLNCPCCSPPAILDAPTTLHCGHTVCSSHVRKHPPHPSSLGPSSSSPLPHRPMRAPPVPPPPPQPPLSTVPVVPSCPLPTCRPPSTAASRFNINIPQDSTVALYPPIPPPSFVHHPPASDQVITVLNPRIDVTVSRLISLMHRIEHQRGKSSNDFVPTLRDESEDESEEEASVPEDAVREECQSGEPVVRPASSSHVPHSPSLTNSSERRLHSDRDSPPGPPYRPHKRQRRHDVPPSPPLPPGDPEERFNKELMDQLTCEICFMLMFQPVTTPCQHTFCAKCLQRSLDHASKCPLCRQDLPAFSYFQDHPYNKVLLSIILKAFPDVYNERRRAIEAEERDARLDTPIFVCQLSFPGMPTLLHFFEPRYRLMLRRCLESPTPSFGMIMPPRTSGTGTTNDYGTMLEIRSVQLLPDGRSMVETWGSYRFRILERGSLDGYMVGRVERIDDVPVELEDEAERSIAFSSNQEQNTDETPASSSSSVASSSTMTSGPSERPMSPHTAQVSNEELLAVCHAFLEQLRNGTAPWVVQRLNNTYGPMPTDPSSFSFWMALVLPIEEHEKAKLLPVKSARLRLRLVVHWIEQLNSNWWFSSGCNIA